MPLDLTKPVTTDNYSTRVLPTIRGNDLALAKFLEGETVTSGILLASSSISMAT